VDVVGILDCDVKGFDDELGAAQIDLIAHDGIDGFHEGNLDGFLGLDESHGDNAGTPGGRNATDHALMEVAKFLFAQGGRAALDSGDPDVGTDFDMGIDGHKIDTE